MKLSLPLLAAAALTETVLGALALQGGPHGSLGPWVWIMQLPGAFAVIDTGTSRFIYLRLAFVFVVQTALWFCAFAVLQWGWRRFRAVT